MGIDTKIPRFWLWVKPACTDTEISYFAWSKFDYYKIQMVNNKGTDQTVDAQAGLSLCYLQATKYGLLRKWPIWCDSNLRCTVGNCLTSLNMSHCVGCHTAMLQFETKLQKCIRMGITIFKIFTCGAIVWDIRSEIRFYGSICVSP